MPHRGARDGRQDACNPEPWPLQHPELAARQLEYAVKNLGARGASVGGHLASMLRLPALRAPKQSEMNRDPREMRAARPGRTMASSPALGGVGLGLYVSRRVAQAHGASFAVRNARLGLEVNIRFPVDSLAGTAAGAQWTPASTAPAAIAS